jgi:hypothetical protein
MFIKYDKIQEQLMEEPYEKMEGILEYIDSFNNLSIEPRYIMKCKKFSRKYAKITSCDLNCTGYSYDIGIKNAYKYSEQELAKLTVIHKINEKEFEFIDTITNKVIEIIPSLIQYFISFGYQIGNESHSEKYSEYLNQREKECPNPDFEKTYIKHGGGWFTPSYYSCRSFLYKKNNFKIRFV